MDGRWFGCVRAISFVFALLVVLSAEAYDSDNESLENVVRTLKGQVNALLERRQEDFRILEDSIRRSLDKNTGLVSVKAELDDLRREVEKIRGGPKPTLNEQKNDHITVQWLSTAISELRAELAEVSATYNSSAEMQQSQELSAGLDLLRGDVASFRRDLEELRAEQQQTVVTLGQLKQDVESSIGNGQKAMAMAVNAKSEVERMKTEMASYVKLLNKVAREVKLMRTLSSKDYDSESLNEKKYRHHRILRQQVAELERGTRDLRTEQSRLEKSLHKVEKQLKTSHIHRIGQQDNEAVDERLAERVARLEEAGRSTVRQMFNVTSQVSELNRLHMSMLQLLESVESLENKMDKNIPELQREISKMEFNMAQTASTMSVYKEDQKSQRSTLKNLGSTVARLEERMDIDHGHITSLQAQFLNITLRNWYRNDTVEIRRENVQDSRIAALEEKLETHIEDEIDSIPGTTTVPEIIREETLFNRSTLPELIHSLRAVQKEYLNLVHQLPRDCGAVDGKSGIYAISPGEGPPLLVSCDMKTGDGGWTVVQRRIDGSQDFNRKWKEYAEGFGTPSGELWLGNEALHRLTAENCSSLRVEITDIYGKQWLAEYEGFHISDSSDGYRIQVFGYSGNASDALEYQNLMEFSAVDSDRDISNTHCAQNYKGGWWFSHCQHANLNGRYNLGLTWFDGTRNEWIAVAFSEMKVRRRKNCDT